MTGFPQQLLSFDDAPRPRPHAIRHDHYDYRPDGYPTTHTAQHAYSQRVQRHYSLDSIGRVTAIHNNGILTEAYSYDSLNNITATLPDPVDTGSVSDDNDGRFVYHNNLLVRAGRTSYFYDRAGRLIRKVTTRLSRRPAVWAYKYDAFDQLTGVCTPDQQWWSYTYDAYSRRRLKQHRAVDRAVLGQTEYVWDATEFAEEYSEGSAMRWQYLPGTPTPIVQHSIQAHADWIRHVVVNDLVGAPTDLIDPITARCDAAASTSLWGRSDWHGIVGVPIRFPGQYFDTETGLHYNLHRFYDPVIGGYLTPDPLGLAPAPNPNTYPHNPTSWIDPLGLACKEFNTNDRNLSDPNPVPARIREQYEEIRAGNGTPRIDPATGQQTVFQGRELSPRQQAQWSGSLEWDVPGTNHRILERPDGLLGYVYKHDYSAPFLFPGPWYPEGGTIPKRLGG